jgi:hypothetical protein
MSFPTNLCANTGRENLRPSYRVRVLRVLLHRYRSKISGIGELTSQHLAFPSVIIIHTYLPNPTKLCKTKPDYYVLKLYYLLTSSHVTSFDFYVIIPTQQKLSTVGSLPVVLCS